MKVVCSFLFFLFLVLPALASPHTERAASAVSSVSLFPKSATEKSQVSIRIIEASQEKSEENTDPSKLSVDPRLEDLRDKFVHLPYVDFKLNAEASKFIAIKQKEPIRLMNGQRIYVRVVDYTDEESTIWLRWVSASGEVLLDTRMGVVFNDAMVVGLDQMTPQRPTSQQATSDNNSSGHGLVLAVKVSPIVTGG